MIARFCDYWHSLLESVFKDIVQALRVMRANPRFTLAAIAMLALSIGANTAVVTLVNATLFKGYPQVKRNDRLLYLTMNPDCCVSYPSFEDWRAIARSFQGMAAVHDSRRTFSDGDHDDSPRTYYATEITANTFRLVGRQPVLGRDFTHEDELPGAEPVVILSYRLWDQRYHRDPAVLGRTVRINGQTSRIIGVMPQRFSFPQNQDLWVPMIPTAFLRDRSKSGAIWYILGRLADGVSVGRARAEMETIGRRLRTAYPRTDNALPLVRTFPEFFIRSDSIRVYQAMVGAVSFLLLIACANLANLLLGRSIDRSRELSVRLALGASRWRITRQLLVESLLLSVPGGVLGWAIARYGVSVYARFADGAGLSSQTGIWFANILDYSMDSRVFAYLAAVSLGTALLFGMVPALKLSSLDIHRMLKDGGRGATGGARGNRLSTLLVMGETALTVVLLAGSGVMIRSFLKVYNAEIGFDTSRVLMMVVPQPGYTPSETLTFTKRLKERLEAVPGVEAVAIANTRPVLPGLNLAYTVADTLPAAAIEDEQSLPKTSWTTTTPDYFRSLGRSMLAGRDFNDADDAAGKPVAIVNRQFAAAVWPNQNAIGKHMRFFERNVAGPWLTVIGIAPDIAQGDFLHPLYHFLPEVYFPYRQRPFNTLFVQARTRVPPASLANIFYRELHALDPALPVLVPPQSMAENLGQTHRYQGTTSLLFLIFAAIALLLASAGLYSVVAHSVSRRTQEIGIRIALGATAARILALVSSQAMVAVGGGLAAGIAASLAVNRVLDTFLVGVSPSDPVALMGTTVLLIVCAALGCLIPAARAARTDPAKAIRYDG
jgi:putative ABC transport system permease protein